MSSQNYKDFCIPEKVKKMLNDEKWIKEQIAQGKSAHEILNISDREMGELYQAATLFFDTGRYTDSAKTYLFLVTLNPRVSEYWLGLAMSAQMCGDYEGALEAYEMIDLEEINSPAPYFYLANCLFALHDNENALSALELTLEIAADHEEFAEIRKQALKTKKLIMRKK